MKSKRVEYKEGPGARETLEPAGKGQFSGSDGQKEEIPSFGSDRAASLLSVAHSGLDERALVHRYNVGDFEGCLRKGDKIRLRPELVPRPLWGISAYRLLKNGVKWKNIRNERIMAAKQCCEICGEKPSRLHGDPLTCHEVWDYDDKKSIATLVGFRIHCSDCDAAVHIGRTAQYGGMERAIAQIAKVNRITNRQAEAIVGGALTVWQKRSTKKWRVTVLDSLRKHYPQLSILEGAHSGRT